MKRISELELNYDEFVALYKSGKLNLRVNAAAAGHLFQGALSEYAGQQAFLRTLTFVALPAGIIAFFFVEWYYAVGLIFFFFFMSKVSQGHAASSFQKELLENEQFFDEVKASTFDFVMVEER